MKTRSIASTTQKFFVITAFTAAAWSCSKKNEEALNQAPVAEAGPSQTITLPANQLVLQGNGWDVDGDVATFAWSQVSGPNNAHFDNAADPTTPVTGLVQGNYLFRLSVTDNKGATGVDTVTMRVLPAPAPAYPSVTLTPVLERQISILGYTDLSTSSSPENIVAAWTSGGEDFKSRSALRFDMSSIPAGATVRSAVLYLYSAPTPNNGNLADANYGWNNAFSILRITAPWSATGANWSNQPATTTVNRTVVPHTSLSRLTIDANVTALVSDMLQSGNYGFFLKLEDETPLRSRLFASSAHANASLRPKLVIEYQ
ncbi:DNRLRE domain-containing protein [Flaviaesturariibacter aridisoli]|uniref:DNRLRE domain-containing protein n=1 Tax=Flaviaesturariibacter aridisoli TaxID=2545761 RepID=A0A4R4E3Z6_9BACT|nr:DNRLRE domain-containing protein [Flaviaesturariibacter aridisoli]TCZ74159.1 DNRLRE domain-containing protein [Flaviaesturariibacter aridisoli]